jgi:hypothetical protein
VQEPTRDRLLAEYAEKPIRKVLQLDCWYQDYISHGVIASGREGHIVMAGETYELRNTTFPVRVQISEGADKETVLALLATTYSMLASRWKSSGWESVVAPPKDLRDVDDETWF